MLQTLRCTLRKPIRMSQWVLYFYAVDIVGVLLLLYWCIKNDDLPPGKGTTGLFAYRDFGQTEHPSVFAKDSDPNRSQKP